MSRQEDSHWHAQPADAVLDALQAVPAGLSAAEAALRLDKVGPNRLLEQAARSPVLRFLGHFHNILIYVLLVSAVITALMGHLVDTSVILAVVLANAIIGFIQEGRAEDAMAAIRQMLAPRSTVLRDGARAMLDATEVVPGDIVLLEAGDRIPADIRLLECRRTKVEEATLTGESIPVEKNSSPVPENAPLGDRTSMAFSGTLMVSGMARGVVVATGSGTELGRISGMLSRVEMLATPLVRQMDLFARWLTAFILLVSVALLVFGTFVRQLPFDEMFMIVVGLAVAAIPEGLPAVLTITLAVGVQAMAKRNAIVRRLPAIETLGSVSVICTDKTGAGTLTRNEMMAATLVTSDREYTVEGAGYEPAGQLRADDGPVELEGNPVLAEFARAAALCNEAVLARTGDDWNVEGDPMEGALLTLAGKISVGSPASFEHLTRTDMIPFDAAWRYMAILCHDHRGGAFVYVKGAPEAVLAMCKEQQVERDAEEPLDEIYWATAVERLAGSGQRVLALARRTMHQDETVLKISDIEGELTMIGLVGLIDPPRPEAVQAVAECHAAGIRVKMITGDHGTTARAIAAMIGLTNTSCVLTGADIAGMEAGELAEAAMDVDIFARTSPADKLSLVTALQSRGLIVAMTGDGVNDAPALKRADAGTAMGIKGSEAAKESSELVLADDNFASIATAVREGRTVYDNITKVIGWTLPTSAGEAMTIIVAVLAGLALPVTAVQILWINLITATTLGVALAFEPSEIDTMLRPPRRRDAPLLTGELIWHILLVSSLFVVAVFGVFSHALDKGYPLALAQTMAVNTLVVLEIFHLFFIRNIHGTSLKWSALKGTPVVWLSVLAVTAAQFAITYVQPLQAIFGTRAVPIYDGLLIVGVGAVFFVLIEIEKQLRLTFIPRVKRTSRPG